MKKQKELTMMEELILESMAFNTKCPYCGRAVHITPKDMNYLIGVTYTDKDGKIQKKIPSGFVYTCKCNKDIPVGIMIGIDDDRIENDTKESI